MPAVRGRVSSRFRKLQGFESFFDARILRPKGQGFESIPVRRILACVGAVAVLVLATGCGSDEPAAAPAPSDTASTEAPGRTLHDTCPLLEQATPSGVMPSDERLTQYAERLVELAAEGDAEADNVIGFLADATDALLTAPSGSEYGDAFDAMTSALDTAASRCLAVGSSSFQ